MSSSSLQCKIFGIKRYVTNATKRIQARQKSVRFAYGLKHKTRRLRQNIISLSIKNTSADNDYINPNYISAKVDGKNIEHTFLVNDPKSYPTLFTNIEAGKTIGGFIVWEVPNNWKKFQMEYSAWKNIDGLVLTAKFTPDDLKDPIIYNANDFN